MCGINGIIGADEKHAEHAIRNMTAAMAHRGPDAEGFSSGKGFAFGHRRLSIIDLDHAADQPLHDQSGRYTIVFNGEIYNYREIREELDYPWKTHSDTEVIIAAYIRWGRDCLNKLNGMFAFAIWDREEECLFAARDRLGVKPFYYYASDGVFIFSSEIRSILASGMVSRKVDKASLADYLRMMTVRTPYTIIQNVFQLKPGECAIWKNGELTRSQWWSLINDGIAPKSATRKEVLNGVREKFKESVKSRMVADVKVGAFLSGGIDSSAVVAEMATQNPEQTETFSIVFRDKEFDESPFSRKIAETYHTRHTEFLLEPHDLIGHLPAYIRAMDSPTVDGINTYIVSKLVAETGIKVVLTGIGGDELYAGYSGFHRWKKYRKLSKLRLIPGMKTLVRVLSGVVPNRKIAKLAQLISRRDAGLSVFYANSRGLYLDNEISRLIRDPAPEHPHWIDLDQQALKKYPEFSQYSIAELSGYTLDVLMKDTDQMSMAWSLEVREPFFDYRLIEHALTVTDDQKYDGRTPKSIFVEAMGELLPPLIVHRPKKGFTFPWKNWLRGELSPYCSEALTSLAGRGLFHENELNKLWNAFLNERGDVTWMHIWSLVILEKWMNENNIEI